MPTSPLSFALSVATCVACLVAGEGAYRRSALRAAVLESEAYPIKAREYLASGGADVVVVGSSRMYHGMVAPYLAELAEKELGRPVKVYNLGVPAGDMNAYSLASVDVLRAKPPKIFIFGMSPIEWTCCPTTHPSSPRWVASVRPWHGFPLLLQAVDAEEGLTDFSIAHFQSLGARTHVLAYWKKAETPPPVYPQGQFGWVSFGGPVDPGSQDYRAGVRTKSYREWFYAPNHFDWNQTNHFFRASADRLRAAGVQVAIIGTPQARQMDENHRGESSYPTYVTYMQDAAREYGSEFVNFNEFPGLSNADFADGDHLIESGARKFSRLLGERVVIPVMRGEKPKPF